MTTLVTGATGFLGRHLVGALVADGRRVRVLARPGAEVESSRRLGVEIAEGDLADPVSLRRAALECECVFHLAGVVSHRRRDLASLESANVAGTRNLLAAVEPSARIVHVSSVAAIGPVGSKDERADETHPFPTEAERLPYARTKRAGERLALEACQRGLDVVVGNPGFLLGPGDVHRVSTWPVSAYLAGTIRFTTPGGLSFVDARDVARGLIALAAHGRRGERTILAADAGNLAWDAFFSLVARTAGRSRLTARLPRAVATAAATLAPWLVAPDEVRAASHWWFVTAAKAERELGFTTRPLAETVADTIHDHEPIRGA